MSDDLVLWRWGKTRHVSAATCFLLTAEGFECEDAAVLDDDRLREALLHELSGTPGSVDCNASSRALVVEAHGVEPTRLRTIVRAFAQSEDLVVFDPQVDPVSGADRSAAEALMRRLASEDERARWGADLPELVAKAEQGDAGALVDLGNRYFFGEGTGTDVSRAFHCYRRAAEAGNEAGIVNLASCYRKGEGVERNPAVAAHWYEKAMATDETFAPFELGQMFENGEGVDASRERAIQLYSVALAGGHPEARAALRRLGALPPAPIAFVRGN